MQGWQQPGDMVPDRCPGGRSYGNREKRGIPLVLLLLIPLAITPLFSTGFAEFEQARMEQERQMALATLHSLADLQAEFRNGDRDGDGVPDYSGSLAELHEAGLIEEGLSDGVRNGYVFTLAGSSSGWSARATPVRDDADGPRSLFISGGPGFTVLTDGMVLFSRPSPNSVSSVCIQ